MGESLDPDQIAELIRTLLAAYPDIQGIYLYGSAAEGGLGADSDVDIAVLLPHRRANAAGSLAMSETRFELERMLGRPVDLVNARTSPIVLQKEIVATGACVFARDPVSIDEYEMRVLSAYGKLNEERKEILDAFLETGRAYPV